MKKETIVKSLLGLGIVALLVLGSFKVAHAATEWYQNAKVVVMGNYIEAPGSDNQGPRLGALTAQTPPAHVASDASITLNDSYFNGNAEVSGVTYLDGVTYVYGAFNYVATGSPTGLVGTINATGSTGTTTVCSYQNTSGASQVILQSSAALDLAAASASTLATTLTYGVTSTSQGTPTGANIVIGPIAITTTTAEQVVATTSVSKIILPANSFLVLKSSATTSQAINCRAPYFGF